MTFQKLKPRVINYRDYKHFNNERFRDDSLFEISNSYVEFDNNSFDEFFNMCRWMLDQHAPRKQKYARGNHMPFMNKKSQMKSWKELSLRPVIILSNMSRIFERIIFRQISNYIESFLSKYQCGFRKGYSVQHCFLFMLEKWKRAIDNGKVFGILSTNLSKAFDYLSHELLLVKLHAYGFSILALRLVYSYLVNRKQRT